MPQYHVETDKGVNDVTIHANTLGEVFYILRNLKDPPTILAIFRSDECKTLVYKRGEL